MPRPHSTLIKSEALEVGAGARHQYFFNRLYFSQRNWEKVCIPMCRVPIFPQPPFMRSLPHYPHPHRSSLFVTVNEPTLTRHHPESIITLGRVTRCGAFCGFGPMCSDMYLPLHHHTEDFRESQWHQCFWTLSGWSPCTAKVEGQCACCIVVPGLTYCKFWMPLVWLAGENYLNLLYPLGRFPIRFCLKKGSC